MKEELGLFPLNLIVFPGEHLNLHVFEPRYKQLVTDCLESGGTFGIPAFVEKEVRYGTEVKILEVTKEYEDGKMDIKTLGIRSFEILDFQNPWADRLYAGGLVSFLEYDDHEDAELKLRLIDLVSELFRNLQVADKLKVTKQTGLLDIVHKIGLDITEEYELLKMNSEKERLHFTIQHLKRMMPALERAEQAKEKINQNGHFKHMDPLKF